MELSVKTGRAQKIHIYIDGEYKMTVDSNFWYSEKWHNFNRIDEEELAELECSVNSRRAFLNGMSLLSRRAHSKKEIITKLSQKYPKEAAQSAADRLEELRLIDDKAFAELYAQELYERKKYSPKRIEQELKQKGITSEIAFETVKSLDKDDFNRIILLLNSKYRNKLSDEKNIKRTINGLMRMGYSYSDIKKALNEVEDTDNDLKGNGNYYE